MFCYLERAVVSKVVANIFRPIWFSYYPQFSALRKNALIKLKDPMEFTECIIYKKMRRIPQIESGIELLSRLSKRPLIEGLDSRLFSRGPHVQETIEISGNVSSGKTLLLTQTIAKCILPSLYGGITIGGRGIAVLLINTDHHFRISKLVQLMQDIVKKSCARQNILHSATTIRELVIIPSLENLTLVNCYDNSQFKMTLGLLDDILTGDPRIGLVALDGISSFYWQDRETGGAWLIDQYIKNILKIVQAYIFQFNIVLVYTRPSDFVSKTSLIELAAEPTVEKINRRINFGDGSLCTIETAEEKKEIMFSINATGIEFNVEGL